MNSNDFLKHYYHPTKLIVMRLIMETFAGHIGNPNGNATFHDKRVICLQAEVTLSINILLLGLGTFNCWNPHLPKNQDN